MRSRGRNEKKKPSLFCIRACFSLHGRLPPSLLLSSLAGAGYVLLRIPGIVCECAASRMGVVDRYSLLCAGDTNTHHSRSPISLCMFHPLFFQPPSTIWPEKSPPPRFESCASQYTVCIFPNLRAGASRGGDGIRESWGWRMQARMEGERVIRVKFRL